MLPLGESVTNAIPPAPPVEGDSANVAALRAAISHLQMTGGGKISLPAGTYRFSQTAGSIISLDGLANVEIDATGVKMVLSGRAQALLISACRGVRITGLTVDWARPPFSQGTVIFVEPDGKSTDIMLDTLSPADGWTRVEAIGTYDRARRLTAVAGVDVYHVVDKVDPISSFHVRLGLSQPIDLRVGDTVVLRHQIYGTNAIDLRRCADVELDRVTVHSAPGMAVVGSRCSGVTLRELSVVPPPRSKRLMSTCADGAHFVDCDGKILFERCRFFAMGDDAINVHGTYWRILEQAESNALIVNKRDRASFKKLELPKDGDKFSFASGKGLASMGSGTLMEAAVRDDAPMNLKLVFKEPLPDALVPGDVIIRIGHGHSLTVRECRFDGNRARGVLAHRDVAILNNSFLGQSEEAILMAPDLWWMEGPEVANVVIRGNNIKDVNRSGHAAGAIRIDSVVATDGGQAHGNVGHPNHNVQLMENVIQGGHSQVVLRGF